MTKFCFLNRISNDSTVRCSDCCVMYEDGCLLKKAVKTYVKNHTPLEIKHPTEEELNRLSELLKETLSKYPAEPVLFRHPDLNVKPNNDNYVDWYPHGSDDIAP